MLLLLSLCCVDGVVDVFLWRTTAVAVFVVVVVNVLVVVVVFLFGVCVLFSVGGSCE